MILKAAIKIILVYVGIPLALFAALTLLITLMAKHVS